MRHEHLEEVMEIETRSFKNPWKKSYFEYDLKRKGGFLYVAQEKGEILGYVDAWLLGDELHLANIAVKEEYRRQGIGTKLLKKVIDLGRKYGASYILLEVRLTNTSAQKFYEKLGFEVYYTRKKYYPDGEDAIVYKLGLRTKNNNRKR
jgi:ribosomal-protein-alanine N-acetyltransferase